MYQDFNFTARALLAIALSQFLLAPGIRAASPDTTAIAATAGASPVLATGEPDPQGRLTFSLRSPGIAGVVKQIVVTGADGAIRETSLERSSDDLVTGAVVIRASDTQFTVTAPGVTATGAVPPMFFPKISDSYANPGMDPVYTVNIPFTRRLAASQKPPRVTTDPAVPGLTTHIDGNNLVLTGAIPTRTVLRVKFESDVLGEDGWVLKAGETIPVKIGAREGSAAFTFDSGVLSPHGSLGIPFRTCNLGSVKISDARLSPDNLVAALHSESLRSTLAETSAEREVTLKTAPDEVREMLFDLRPKKDSTDPATGVRLLRIEWKNPGYGWQESSAAFVQVTDIGLTPMLDADGRTLTVWATAISTGKPLSGVSVEVRNPQNRAVAHGRSDASGLVKLSLPGQPHDAHDWFVMATLGEDFAFARTAGAENDDNKAGLPARAEGPVVLLYGERGVWRGGETVRLTGLARTADGKPMPPVPLEIRLCRPDGAELTRTLTTPAKDTEGFFRAEFPLSPEIPYGNYTAGVYLPGDDTALTTLAVPVAAFEPLRLKTTLENTGTTPFPQTAGTPLALHAGDAPSFTLQSRYRFGSPASGLASMAVFRVAPATFSVPSLPGFVFGYADETETRQVRAPGRPLDDTGARVFTAPVSPAPGAWKIACTGIVTEPAGRSDNASAKTLWINTDVVPGISLPDSAGLSAGRECPVRVALAGADGKPIATGLAMSVVAERIIENWTLQREHSRMIWRKTEEKSPAGEWSLDAKNFTGGFAEVAFTPAAAGLYRITARIPGGACCSTTAYVGGLGETTPGAAPHHIALRPVRTKVAPGTSVDIGVEAPFTGTALLTIETDRVLESRIVTLDTRTPVIPVTLPAGVRDSALVTLREVRPLDIHQPAWKPVVARGSVMLLADNETSRLGCAVEAPVKAAPGEKTTVAVRVSGNAGAPVAVHLWAVDSGVLDITGYKTPDIFDTFLGPKSSGVLFLSTLDQLLPDFARTLERIGAGDGAGVFRRSNLSHRKAVAVVDAGVALTGPDGLLRAAVTLPDHTGELRWMAVAAQGDRYGSGSASSVLSRPVLVETSTPAFVAPGDTLVVPVAFFNNTGAPLTVKPSATVSGATILTGLPESVPLAADGKPWRGFVTLKAAGAEGPADLTVSAAGDFPGGVSSLAAPFNTRAAATVGVAAESFVLAPGESRTLNPDTDRFVAGSAGLSVVASGTGFATVAPKYAALVAYPYGCAEQTSSRILALCAAGDAFALPGSDTGTAGKARAEALIRQGLDRLALLARSEGGIGYWPQASVSDAHASVIAAEALVAAKTHGAPVRKNLVENLTGYLRKTLYAEADENEQARLCAALAGLGVVESNRMTYLAGNSGRLNADGIAALSLAYSRTGDRARAAAVLNAGAGLLSPSTAIVRGENRYDSSVETDALVLDALEAADPDSPRAAVYAASLTRIVATEELNTLEQGAALGALARRNKTHPDSGDATKAPALSIDGIVARETAPATGRVSRKVSGAKPVTLKNTGEAAAFVSVVTTGIAAPGASSEESRGLSVSREIFDTLTGEPVAPEEKLAIGRALTVRVSLRVPGGKNIPDVAVADLFPACFEAEGARVKTLMNGKALESWNNPVKRTEVREDRVIAFVEACDGLAVEYCVRVNAAGRFTLPAPQAVSMYRPDIRATGISGVVESVR